MVLIFLMHLLIQPVAFSQGQSADLPQTPHNTEKGIRFSYGLNLGLFLAHPQTASYYNGEGQSAGGNLRPSLAQTISNDYTYNQIRNSLGYDFSLHQLPGAMKYDPALMFGLFGEIRISDRFSVSGEFNYTRLQTRDAFTLMLDRFSSIEGDNIETFLIRGNEERSDLRLGGRIYTARSQQGMQFYFETGASLIDLRVRENSFTIAGNAYSLYVPGNYQFNLERDFGIGFGAYFSAGSMFSIANTPRLGVGYTAILNRINLGNNQDMLLQHSLLIRLLLNR